MQCTREAAVQRAALGTRRITRGGPQAVGGARLPARSALPSFGIA